LCSGFVELLEITSQTILWAILYLNVSPPTDLRLATAESYLKISVQPKSLFWPTLLPMPNQFIVKQFNLIFEGMNCRVNKPLSIRVGPLIMWWTEILPIVQTKPNLIENLSIFDGNLDRPCSWILCYFRHLFRGIINFLRSLKYILRAFKTCTTGKGRSWRSRTNWKARIAINWVQKKPNLLSLIVQVISSRYGVYRCLSLLDPIDLHSVSQDCPIQKGQSGGVIDE
jgi:hypothetical protein